MTRSRLNSDSRRLLVEVALVIIESEHRPKRRNIARREQIEVLAHDPRLTSMEWRGGVAHSTRRSLVKYVMETYGVSNSNARRMLHQARKMRRRLTTGV